jgi:hypothetical protein
MRFCHKFLILLFGLSHTICLSVSADIIHGICTPMLGAFDFEKQVSVHWLHPDADLSGGYVVDPPLGHLAWGLNGALLVMVADSTFEELSLAPEDSSVYSTDLRGHVGIPYVIRTIGGHYAKFRFTDPTFNTIEYAYQSDGSRLLVCPTPGEETTWGRIKALY